MKKSFSMLEIIFVVVVIGIIAMVALPKLGGIGSDAKVSAIKQDISTLKTNTQSYYLINQKIDKISDVVSLNPSVWKIEDKKVIFQDNSKDCLTFELLTDSIKITIDKTVSTVCEKLEKSGIIGETIDLN